MLEYEFIVDLLSDFIDEKKTVIPNNLDWNTVLNITRAHQIDAIVYYQIKNSNGVDCGVLNRYHKYFAESIYSYTRRSSFLKIIENKFSREGLDYMFVKGAEIGNLYPYPALRSMGDIDIVVRSSDKERAGKILGSLGLSCDKYTDTEWVYRKDGLEYELHDSLMYDEPARHERFDAFLNSNWEYSHKEVNSSKHILDWNYHFVFLILHLRKHLINRGAGLRQFMDIAVVSKCCELDWNWIERTLVELNILDFSVKCFECCNVWFGVCIPILKNSDKDFVSLIEESIMKNGVFGFDNEENENSYYILRMQNRSKINIRKLISSIFPSYSSLKQETLYKGLDGKPFLLPIYWCIRFLHSFKKGNVRKALEYATDNFHIPKSEIDQRTRYLKNWGIE